MTIQSIEHLAGISHESERLCRSDGWKCAIVRLDSRTLESKPSVTDLATDRD